MQTLWRIYGCGENVENLWKLYGFFMVFMWRFYGMFMFFRWRFCGKTVEIRWKSYRDLMEVLWNFDRGIYGIFMEVSWRKSQTGMWRNCGTFVWNRHTGKLQTGKYQRRDTMEQYANQTEGLNMLRKILDWATSDSGKETLAGITWGVIGIIAVRLFCFLVCVATGYPIN